MQFDIFFLVSSGIGNVVEMLYAVEYAMKRPGLRVGLFVEKVPASFLDYLKNSYGSIILDHVEGVSTRNLVHSLTMEKYIPIKFDHYFYIKPDRYSSAYLSETEQAISVVKAVYPGGEVPATLNFLQSVQPESIEIESISTKTILYPGCSSINPVKRWPYFQDLIKKIGEKNVMVVGGKDDLNFSASYFFPHWFARLAPQAILNNQKVWSIFKKLGLLRPYSHWPGMEKLPYVYIEKYSWAELVWLFRHANQFIGNDGGLTHLAGAAGANGVVFFGPTSVEKNRPYHNAITALSNGLACSPCQFAVGGIQMTKGYINCPYGIACLTGISVESILPYLTKK